MPKQETSLTKEQTSIAIKWLIISMMSIPKCCLDGKITCEDLDARSIEPSVQALFPLQMWTISMCGFAFDSSDDPCGVSGGDRIGGD